jgi:CBS domain-containing protein/sporulation protein YlmC with PRC-barrel domain
MPFLSGLLGQTIRDADNRAIGKLTDVIVDGGQAYPIISGVAYKAPRSREVRVIPFQQMADLEPGDVKLRVKADEVQSEPASWIRPQPPVGMDAADSGYAADGSKTSASGYALADTLQYRPSESHDNRLPLARRILDRQIIDINGRRLVRVNDLQLLKVNGQYRLIGADISARGILRRLGLGALAGIVGRDVEGQYIAWDAVDPLGEGTAALKLKYDRLSKMHPADIAEIVAQLGKQASTDIFESLDAETAADTLQEFDTELQVEVIEGLDDERAADIIEAMEPDEAADLLAEMPEDRANILLTLMDQEEAEDVRSLLAYEEDTAGGLMTTEYVAIPATYTAEQTINRLRELAPEAETVYYVYVTDEEEHLLGVLSLRDLIVAQPHLRVADFMRDGPVSVTPDTSHNDVAFILAKYNLLAVPVVDEEKRLLGIVTIDDAIDYVLPHRGRHRTHFG